MKRRFLAVGLALLCAGEIQSQPSNPPPTRALPVRVNPPARPAQLPPMPTSANSVSPTPTDPHAGHNHAAPRVQAVPAAVPSPGASRTLTSLPNSVLAWDAELKEYTTKPGEVQGSFAFHFTNVSTKVVAITSAAASCGCTVPRLPAQPWNIAPGATGEIPVTMNVAGKTGAVLKTVTINTDHGPKILTVKITVTPPDPAAQHAMSGPMDRSRNQELAKADRTAIFRGDCASCHVEKGRGKLGKELYDASCGICHDAEHRAEMVPDLRNLKHDTNADYWRTWISLGKPGTLMPGFAQSEGGPLTRLEIESLVHYLATTIPSQAVRPAAGN